MPADVSAACGCTAAPAGARQGRQAGQAQRGHHRLPIGQDHLKRGQREYDAGKRVKGRKRHIDVDAMGLLLAVVVAFGWHSGPDGSQGFAGEAVHALER